MTQTGNVKRDWAGGRNREYDVATGVHFYHGMPVCFNSSGYCVPASATTGLITKGCCTKEVDNTDGDDGDVTVELRTGYFLLPIDDGDAPTIANLGDVVYWASNDTICATGTGKSVAGILEAFEGDMAIVLLGVWPMSAGLLAANNLSDVGSASSARASIGANQFEQTVYVESLVSGARYGFVAPKGVTITKMKSVLLGHALATGNATLQGKIAGTNITNGLITITQAGSAIGDVDSATPTAANVATEDQLIEVTVGGTNSDTDARASVTFYGTY